jgi:hypothetical protein
MPVKYTSEATFYEKAKASNGNNASKSTALLLLGEDKEYSAIVMLKSHKILEAALKKLDLQATLEPYTILPSPIVRVFKHLNYAKENLMAQGARLIRSRYPVIADSVPEMIAKNVVYSGEVPLYFDLQFSSPSKYVVTDSIAGKLGEGSLGVPFKYSNVEFTIEGPPRIDENQRRYELKFKPIRKMAEDLSDDLKVISDYKDKSFISLTLHFRSRKESSDLLNAVMEAYREHLLEEHHLTVASQVEYLKQRRQTMEEQLAVLMHEHAEQLSAHAGSLDLLVATQQGLQKKLLAIDLEIKHVQQTLNEGTSPKAHYSSDNDPPFIHQTLAEIRRYCQQCDSIDAALGNSLTKDFVPNRQKSLGTEFRGIDLDTANTLFLSYSRELNETEANANQNQYILDKIPQPDFEMSSLIAVLTDPVSQDIVRKASTLAQTIKDQTNRTSKELERLNHDLDMQRNFLSLHLKQIVELLQLRVEFLRNKVKSIQAVTFDLLQQKISLLEKSMHDYAASHLNSLKHEQTLILKQKQALQSDFDKLPEQWASEKLLDLYLKTDASIMQTIGSLIESKNISDHLEMSLSAPFDKAIPPLHPKSPHLIVWALFGAFLGGFGVTFFAVMSSVKHGISTSEDNLRLMGQHVAGTLSNSTETKLETLRRLGAYLCPIYDIDQKDHGKTILVLESQEGNYGPEFATLLNKRNLKVIVLDITFDSTAGNSKEGLLSYLEGSSKEIQIIRGSTFDKIIAGGTTNYGNELLESAAFQKLLSDLREKYDCIVAISKNPLLSAQTEALLPIFDSVAITVTDEK